jgi:hypothetical protein
MASKKSHKKVLILRTISIVPWQEGSGKRSRSSFDAIVVTFIGTGKVLDGFFVAGYN